MSEMQEAAEEKDFEMRQFHDGIFNTCNVIEFSADGYVTDINSNMLNVWKSQKSDFMGKHYSSFVNQESFNTVWADLVRGMHHTVVSEVSGDDGKTIVFRNNYMPVCNRHGELIRVMLLAFPE